MLEKCFRTALEHQHSLQTPKCAAGEAKCVTQASKQQDVHDLCAGTQGVRTLKWVLADSTPTAVRTLEADVRTMLEHLRQVLEQLASWTVLTPGWPSC